MATDAVAICNSALLKIGTEKITSLSDNTKRAIICNEQYAKIRDQVLRAHPWNFAIKRVTLSVAEREIGYADVSTSGDSFEYELHGYWTGQTVQISTDDTLPAPLAASTNYYVIKVDKDNFKLAASYANALAGTQINLTTQGAGTHTIEPQYTEPDFEYTYQYSIPSDCLRILNEQEYSTDFKIENGAIVSNADTLNLRYIYQVTDTTKFDKNFDEALSYALAADLAYNLVQSSQLASDMMAKYNLVLRETRSFDAQEGYPDKMDSDLWLNVRF